MPRLRVVFRGEKTLRGLYVSLTVGMVLLTLWATTLQRPTSIIPAGGAFVCFVLLVTVFLFETLYKWVTK